MAVRKSWKEKMATPVNSIIKRIEKGFADLPANSSMYISTPKELDNFIREIPFGTNISVLNMRKQLARNVGADHTCPLTTGIFLRILSEAAFDEYQLTGDLQQITPFWRVIDIKSPLARKLSCGPQFLLERQNHERSVGFKKHA